MPLPRFAFDLVEILEEMYPPVEVPTYRWLLMGEDQVRDYCFKAGQRDVIEALIAMRDDDDENEDIN